MVIHPTEAEFKRLTKRGNIIPVYGELMADLETPVSAFLKLDDGRLSFLLESVEGEEKVARFSFLGSRPRILFTSRNRAIEVSTFVNGRRKIKRFQTKKDPFTEIEHLMREFRFVGVPGLPRFCGGLVGYLGYNVVRFIEPRLKAHKIDDLGVADIMLMLAGTMVIFDHAQHKLLIVVNVEVKRGASSAYKKAVREINSVTLRLRKPLKEPERSKKRKRSPKAGRVRSNITRGEFASMVDVAKGNIRSGQIIQVVLSQRFTRSIRCGPFDVYRALRSLNPSPYMYFLRFHSLCVAGSSPEMLVRCEDGLLETRPIAGTRPRGRTEGEDRRLIQQLRASPKERAEHLMLVDLGRNDLGRVAQVGSVKTNELMSVEKYSHVLHLVSGVTAKLRSGKNGYDVLRACFPAGTVTGAPKVRAMEIISELERHDRGPYAGAVGYVSFSGNLDTCITIRTILMKDKRAYIQAGAGIVADSRSDREYQETLSKARGMLKAIELAEKH